MQDRDTKMKGYQWSNIIPYQNPIDDPFLEKEHGTTDTMYFQVYPQFEDWFILVLMGLLNKVNSMFTEKEDMARINEMATNSFEEQYKRTSYYLGRA